MAQQKAINAERKSLSSVFQNFVHNEAFGGIILLVCAVVALIFANVPAFSFIEDFWNMEGGVKFGNFIVEMSFREWINDALMTIFFFLVGLEIKREMMVGELAQPKQAMLPIVAALGGMIAPALIFTIFNAGEPSAHGWGIPMATDIAFAMGVLAMLGKKCPLGLKVFLTALAIVDDLGSIIVLAVFYPTHALHFEFFLYAGIVVAILLACNRFQVRHPFVYVLAGVFLWYFVYRSGVHATISGVILAMTIPSRTRINEVKFYTSAQYLIDKFKAASNGHVNVLANSEQLTVLHQLNQKVDNINPLMNQFEVLLHAPVNYLIMPLFALANAGVAISPEVFTSPYFSTIALGIFFGLLIGKPLGIFAFSYAAVKLKLAKLPDNTQWVQLLAIGVVGGIGFTMSLFIDNLAFTHPEMAEMGKVAILMTSTLAAVLGYVAVSITGKRHAKD